MGWCASFVGYHLAPLFAQTWNKQMLWFCMGELAIANRVNRENRREEDTWAGSLVRTDRQISHKSLKD